MKKSAIICSIIALFAISAFAQNQVDLTKLPVLYRIKGQEKAKVERDVIYKKAGAEELKMDVYSPENKSKNVMLPALIFISGTSKSKHWNIYRNYGELAATQGMISIQYDKRYGRGDENAKTALEDTADIIKFLRENAAKFGIDKERIGVWSFSGGGHLLQAGMMPDQPFIKCLVSYYAIGTAERDFMAQLGSKMPPILVVRAGLDRAFVNENIDLFVKDAVSKNIGIEFINYHDGQHSFDILDEKTATGEIIRRTFQFIKDKMEQK